MPCSCADCPRTAQNSASKATEVRCPDKEKDFFDSITEQLARPSLVIKGCVMENAMRFPISLLIFGVFVAGTIAAQAAVAARHGGAVTFAGQSEARDMSLPELQAKVVNCHARYEGKGGDMRVASS
ncbi:MAG: hypothetical protein JWN16_134 [Alphaproteobacteria bacterium]|nr:hypothetical protein [Alphaproteobacteria bacterium]